METVKHSGPWGRLGRWSSLMGMMAIMYLLGWLCIYSGGQTRHNEIWLLKLNLTLTFNLKTNRDLNQGVLHLLSELGVLAWMGYELSYGQTCDWCTDTTHTQTDAGNNTRRRKLASGKQYKYNFQIYYTSNSSLGTHCEILIRWMSQHPTNGKLLF